MIDEVRSRHEDAIIDEVLGFWFGDGALDDATIKRWFRRDDAFDAEIRDKFGAVHAQAAAGQLESWLETPRGELAMVIVLDQFSRNLYRDDPRAFRYDGRAYAVANNLWFSGRANSFTIAQQIFTLMPFQHAEDLEIQRTGVGEYEKLAAAPNPSPMMPMIVDYAKKHLALIERFGRFPHRNAVLGRESTPEERAFLEQPGSRF
jgi:uncharacterized protein (DUF924 family)